MAAKRKKTDGRGGARDNAGRRTYFKGKGRQVGAWFTEKGFAIMDANVDRLNREGPTIPISRSAYIEALNRAYGPKLSIRDIARVRDPDV